MSHKFLFQRSADELQHLFSRIEQKRPLQVSAIILNRSKEGVVVLNRSNEAVVTVDTDTAALVTNCALYKALARTFPQGYDAASTFPRFVDSLLHSALSVLRHADESCNDTDPEEYRRHFCPVEPVEKKCGVSWIRGVLANAFLGNIDKDPVEFRKDYGGGLDLHGMLSSTSHVAVEKVCCLVQYFMGTDPRIGNPDVVEDEDGVQGGYDDYMDLSNPNQRTVVFQKVSLTDDEFSMVLKKMDGAGDEATDPSPPPPRDDGGGGSSTHRTDDTTPVVLIHDGAMEIPTANAFVNFANRNYGYGKFIPSCTQEEILQVCCPEMNVGMLFYGVMDDDSVVLTHGVRRFSSYSGYLRGFRFEGGLGGRDGVGAYEDQTIVTMDASFHGQYTDEGNLRDTKKAYLGWKASLDWHLRRPSGVGVKDDLSGGGVRGNSELKRTLQISTGQWGCGMFGGVVAHKFLQQVIAAQLVNRDNDDGNVRLFFSCFHDPAMKAALDKLRLSGVSPWDLYRGVLLGESRGTFASQNIDRLVAQIKRLGKSGQVENERDDCDITFTGKAKKLVDKITSLV